MDSFYDPCGTCPEAWPLAYWNAQTCTNARPWRIQRNKKLMVLPTLDVEEPQSEASPDFKIICADTTFWAHKRKLCFQSKFFRMMCDSEFKEGRTNELVCHHNPDVVSFVLRHVDAPGAWFWETEGERPELDFLCEVYLIAELWNMDNLKLFIAIEAHSHIQKFTLFAPAADCELGLGAPDDDCADFFELLAWVHEEIVDVPVHGLRLKTLFLDKVLEHRKSLELFKATRAMFRNLPNSFFADLASRQAEKCSDDWKFELPIFVDE